MTDPGRESPPATLEDVLITTDLFRREPRVPDYRREAAAFQSLAQHLADDPGTLLDHLLDLALDVCRAGSSGVSVIDRQPDHTGGFSWIHTAGAFAPYAGAAVPGRFSPSGFTLERHAPQLFLRPARYFTSLAFAQPQIFETLLVQVGRGGERLGTIWLAAHDPNRHFDAEDVRVLSVLGGFTAAALRTTELTRQSVTVNEAKDQFLIRLSHELRQPLNAILGWVDLLRLDALDPSSLGRALDAIRNNTQALAHTLSDVVDFSHIANRTFRIDLRAVDVCAVVESLVAALAPDRDNRVAIRCRVEHPVRFVRADEHRLRQIVSNLVVNAVKFSPDEAAIDVIIREVGDEVEIAVKDTGVGIDPAFLPFLFEPFRQSANRIAGRERGLGIGLTIARDLVEASGGTLTAASAGLGRGTTMVVRLPIFKDETVSGAQPGAPAREHTADEL